MAYTIVGVDIAKNVLQIHWVKPDSGEIVNRSIKRAAFLEYCVTREPCLVGMESCSGSQHWARRLIDLLSVISHNALNLYGAVLVVITSVPTFAYRWIPTAKARAVVSVIIFSTCCYAAIGASTDFVGSLVDLVLALLVVLVPWTAINLFDFYVIHKGKYDIQSFFLADGGVYGRFNPQALIAHAVGIVVQIPFMNTPIYAGPIPNYLDGADLSWVVGLLRTSPLYYWLASRDTTYRRRQKNASVPSTTMH